MRQALLFAHRWLGLTAGLVFAISAATGGILVYENGLNELLVGTRAGITPGLASPATIESSIRSQFPGSRLVRVDWPTLDMNFFNVMVTDGPNQQFPELDPGSGALLQPKRVHILLKALHRVHTSLLMGSIGRTIVRYATFATIVSLLLGLYLWWPGIRRWARGFRLRLDRGIYTLAFDAHQTFGVLALPLLIVMSATGVLLDRQASINIVMSLLDGKETVTSWQALQSPGHTEDASSIGLDEAVRIAQSEAGAGPLTRVEFPRTANGIIQVWTRGAGKWPHNASTRIALDQYTGAVLARQDLAYDMSTNDRLHFGRVGGPVLRLLYFVSCFVGSGLLLTGVVMWWKRSKPDGRPLEARDGITG